MTSQEKKRNYRAMNEGLAFLLQNLRKESENTATSSEEPTEKKSVENPGSEETNLIPPNSAPEADGSAVGEPGAKQEQEVVLPIPPTARFDFTRTPELRLELRSEFERPPDQDQSAISRNNFLKGCKWSPDGSLLLSNSEDRKLRVFEFSPTSDCRLLSGRREGDLVYDFCWYPRLQRDREETCLYLSTSREHPVHLRSALTGNALATYRPINHLDELTSAQSVSFSLDGSRVITGFRKLIRIFDTERAGRHIHYIPTTMKGLGGQSGRISCLCPSPDRSTFAAGSYSRSIGVYSEMAKSAMFVFEAHLGGVTHLRFSQDGMFLFSGARKDPEIRCWDVRKPGEILAIYKREVSTNQRIYFDLDPVGGHLVSGGSDGTVRFWDLNQSPQVETEWGRVAQPLGSFAAAVSAVNGVGLNPHWPILATASGQRIFPRPLDSEEELSDDDTYEAQRHRLGLDNSLRLWNFPPPNE